MAEMLTPHYRITATNHRHSDLPLILQRDRPDLIVFNATGCAPLPLFLRSQDAAVLPKIPLILIADDTAALPDREDLIEDVDDFLMQPFAADVLHTRIRALLQRKLAEAQLRLASHVFRHSGEAIVITDHRNRIVDINPSFSRLTGYEAADVFGRNPSILSSGRTSAEEFQAMWAAIIDHGYWQGEIWDRRKDGTHYPKWLTISTVKNNAGQVDYYIGCFCDISERKEAEEKINRLAYHDSLTRLPNRYNLQGRLDQAIATARHYSRNIALMFIDMDRFKNINDTLGHPVGDGMLREVADRLTATLRDGDIVARLGGDEFVVVLTDVEATVAGRWADKILTALTRTYHIEHHELHSSPSIGIALFPDDGEDVETLMKNADAAMYRAKSSGRNNVKFFTPGMNDAAKASLELERDLHHALERHEFALHYQPQFDENCAITGVEALLRWWHPLRGLVPPDEFIPLAEQTGLILPIGQWVLDTACAQLTAWSHAAQTRDLHMAVNVSAVQFRQADFVLRIRRLIDESGVDPTRLKLELTESVILDNVDDAIAKMLAIKHFGVTFSMDDFGTGYSSLSYLTRLPLDQLKIDRSFVLKLPGNLSDAIVAQTIIALGLSLGLNVIAEGVETDMQRQFLDGHRCRAYQGYLFSRPLALAEFEHYMQAHQPSRIAEFI